MHVKKVLSRPPLCRDLSYPTHHSVMRLGGSSCQDVYCSVSHHWVTTALLTMQQVATHQDTQASGDVKEFIVPQNKF